MARPGDAVSYPIATSEDQRKVSDDAGAERDGGVPTLGTILLCCALAALAC